MRRFFSLIFIMLIALCIAAPASAEIQAMWAYVYKRTYDGQPEDGLTRLTTGVTFKVLQRNSDTAETLYEYPDMGAALTSLTNPVTAANFASDTVCYDRVAFQVDPGESGDRYVDLIVVDTSGGWTQFVEDFDKYQHRIVIDEVPNKMHHGVIWFGASDNTETDTTVDFKTDTAVHRVCVEVVTVDAGETIDIGLLSTDTAGDANGFIAAQSVATAGFYCNDKPTITAGSNETHVSTASNVGALMGSSLKGTNTATDEGSHYIWDHVVTASNADDITYTGSAGSDTAAGYIHYYFTRMR